MDTVEDKKTLWTTNYTIIIIATALGAIGNVVTGFALSFMVFDETNSTLASSVLFALQMIPGLFVPLIASPVMDRYPQKPFLVIFDGVFAVIYLFGGLWLKYSYFRYAEYLVFSLLLSVIASLDELSYNALFPKLIPNGMEEKGYSFFSLLYPTITVIMTPIAAFVYKLVGIPNIMFFQVGCSALACVLESNIHLDEKTAEGSELSLKQWYSDLRETWEYLHSEPGIGWITAYLAFVMGSANGYSSLQIAYFSTVPGFSVQKYSFVSVANLLGRTVGGISVFHKETPKEKKYRKTLLIYLFCDLMDVVLLFLSYPAMLLNRGLSGFFGLQSSSIRYAAVQQFIPENMRARLYAFETVFFVIMNTVLSLLIGGIGELFSYQIAMMTFGILSIVVCILFIGAHRKEIEKIYLYSAESNKKKL